MTFKVLACVSLAACISLPACRSSQPEAAVTPTFARDVAPIVYQHCAPCHRPGEAGPFTLLTAEDLRKRATLVADVITNRYMPPWMPEPGHGTFVGERRLSDAQIALIKQWIDAGAPDGDPRELPPRPTWIEGWQLGQPDLIIQVPHPYRMPADGSDRFRTFIVPVGVSETRYVRAVEFRPGSPRSVHHAVLRIGKGLSASAVRDLDGEADTNGMLTSEQSIASPDGHMLGWAPGYSPNVAPPDMPWRLEPGTALAIELHMQPTGKAEDVQPSVGLFFTERAPERVPLGLQLGSYTIDIAPGDTDYIAEDRYTLPVDVDVLSIYPHAHYLGKDLRAWAQLPNGSEHSLIWIKQWDFNWQNAYRYAAPVYLPRGTTIHMRYVYDNSAANVRNPSQPPRQVRYGGQSNDEMGNLWLQVVPRNGADLALLRTDYTRKSAERQIAGYESLLKQRPGHLAIRRALADAHNFVGVLLRHEGETGLAARAFERALAVSSSHAPARNNLGSIFRSQDRASDALREYRAALTIDPDYADAHFNLGLLLQSIGSRSEAARHLRRAVDLLPFDPQPANALAWLAATDARATPELRAEALRLAQRAVDQTKSRDASALDTLAAAYASTGDFDQATIVGKRASEVAIKTGETSLADDIEGRLALYRSRKPYHQ